MLGFKGLGLRALELRAFGVLRFRNSGCGLQFQPEAATLRAQSPPWCLATLLFLKGLLCKEVITITIGRKTNHSTADDINPVFSLRTLNDGSYGIFLIVAILQD